MHSTTIFNACFCSIIVLSFLTTDTDAYQSHQKSTIQDKPGQQANVGSDRASAIRDAVADTDDDCEADGEIIQDDKDGALGEYIDGSLDKSEAFASITEKQLKEFSKFIESPSTDPTLEKDVSTIESLIAENFEASELRPEKIVESFKDEQTVVRRMITPIESGQNDLHAKFTGRERFLDLIKQLIGPMVDCAERRVKFKTFRVNVEDERITTQVYYHATGFKDRFSFEQNATWELEWTLPKDAKLPLLRKIVCTDYEEAEFNGVSGTQFVDSTQKTFGGLSAFDQQLKLEVEHWRRTYPMSVEIDFRGHHGLAVGDVNGDGLDDLFLCQPNGMPNLLFARKRNGSLEDISSVAGVDVLDESKSVLILDFDNDGDQDIVVSIRDFVLVYSNNGSARFSLEKKLPGPKLPHGMSAADYDNDGDLDLFVCGFWGLNVYADSNLDTAFAIPTPFHDAENGDPNFFYRNEGEFEFNDVTSESGLDQNNTRFSHAATWEDYDNDGDQDLYVANDFGRNNLYRNDNGKFVDVAAELGIEDQAAGMSVTWADYDHDGWMDVYISNMFSAAGGRITYHRKFQDQMTDQVVNEFQRHSRGNTLFASKGSQGFNDVSDSADVVLGRWAWSSNFVDFNNDSWEDLFVANGFVTNEDTGDL